MTRSRQPWSFLIKGETVNIYIYIYTPLRVERFLKSIHRKDIEFIYIYIYISVWICKNVATEISLICPLTESRSGSYFLFFFSRLLFICLIGNGLATVDRV